MPFVVANVKKKKLKRRDKMIQNLEKHGMNYKIKRNVINLVNLWVILEIKYIRQKKLMKVKNN